jgi:hypothetical protein
MVLRPAMIGLALSLVILFSLFLFSDQAVAPFLERREQEKMIADENMPPVLFPVFPDTGIKRVEEMVAPRSRIRVRKAPKSREISPGNSMTFALSIENTSAESLEKLAVEDRFDGSVFSVGTAPGAEVEENRILWSIPVLQPHQLWTVNYILTAMENAEPKVYETTTYVVGDILGKEASTPRIVTSSITVIALPAAGAELSWWMKWMNAL